MTIIEIPSSFVETPWTTESTTTKEYSGRNSISVTGVIFHHFTIIHNNTPLLVVDYKCLTRLMMSNFRPFVHVVSPKYPHVLRTTLNLV